MSDRLCVDCGTVVPPDKRYRRQRCCGCYQRHIAVLKRSGSYAPLMRTGSMRERLLGSTTPGRQGCVIWTGHVTPGGYGSFATKGQNYRVHRVSYELFVGPIPDGLFIDHVCHNRDLSCAGGTTCAHRRCLNPWHLEAVTGRENLARSRHTLNGANLRKTECANGHRYSPENTIVGLHGWRRCRQCVSADKARYLLQKRQSQGGGQR